VSSRDVSGDDLFDAGLDADELAEQRAVRDLLRSLPDPGPVPPDVLDRITQTLRDLEAEQAASVRPAAAGVRPAAVAEPRLAGATAVPLPRRRPHRALWLSAAAALVLSGGGAVVSKLASDGSASESAASVATRTTGSARDTTALASRVHLSGTDYRAGDLAAQARALLAAPATDAGQAAKGNDRVQPPTTSGQEAQRPRLQGPASADSIRACLRALGVAPGDLLAADRATYQGRPALVLVLAAAPARRVRVMAPNCGPGATAELASVSLP
jgi:hypothetical protein